MVMEREYQLLKSQVDGVKNVKHRVEKANMLIFRQYTSRLVLCNFTTHALSAVSLPRFRQTSQSIWKDSLAIGLSP